MTAPDTLDRYRLLYILGEGGMGRVHLASAEGAAGFQKLVALKVLGPKYTNDPERSKRLLREAVIGVRLDHANVVQVLDLGEDDGTYFIAMEYVRGFSVANIIDYARTTDRSIPLRSVVHIARSMVSALEHVHDFEDSDGERLGLIHGDVTPSNILLGIDGRVKLSDFGVAVLAREVEGGVHVAGKLSFLPPEAFTGAPATAAWDLYSLGASTYEAITGKPAFAGANIAELRAAQHNGIVPITELRPECPQALATVIERTFARDPAGRYASASELRQALDDAYERHIDDADKHCDYVRLVFSNKRFVQTHGQLPTTGGFRIALTLTPPLAHAGIANEVTAVSVPQRRKALRFGLSPALGADLARRLGTQLTDYLTKSIERDIRPVVFADYRTLVEALASGEVDVAWMPPFAFVAASELAAGPLVVAVRYGKPTYEAALFVRADSPIESLQDLRGKQAAWIERESASGFQFPAAEIIRQIGKLDEVFAKQHFFGSHRQACEAVLNGWADVGATYSSRDGDGKLVSCGWRDSLAPEEADQLRAIAFVGPIPCDNIAHRPHLPETLRAVVAAALRNMADDDDGRDLLRDIFHADRFVDVDLTMYDSVRARLRLI